MVKKVTYSAESIEVLSGLDPVRRRPGMYTNTASPDHLAHEVIDNSVDEAIAGYANQIDVILYADGSLEVADNGRGMPVDIHPQHRISGVELILTRLHAGAKFSNKNYQFSGGLHGVGISVVNALSERLVVQVKQGGSIYEMEFANGRATTALESVATSNKKDSGTLVRFWPDDTYFDRVNFTVAELKTTLCAKAVLCPGLKISLREEKSGQAWHWFYKEGLAAYLLDQLSDAECLPQSPFTGQFEAETEMADWALTWCTNAVHSVGESYVNLIPTVQGGAHVNGLRAGLLDAMREFCQIHKLLPRGVKLIADDVWTQCCYVLSVKMQDPQFAGQTKERLTSRQSAVFVAGVVKDAFSLWLNHHVPLATELAILMVANAQRRLRVSRQVTRKRVTSGPALPGKLSDCATPDVMQGELFLVEGDSAGGSAKQARDRGFQAVMPLLGKIMNTWEVRSEQVLASTEIHNIAIALGVDPGSTDISGLRYGKVCILADADSDGAHIATLLCALFLKHFSTLVAEGHIYVAMPPLYRIDVNKSVFYALDDYEKQGVLDRIKAEGIRGKVNIQRFKGLGEMNPMQLRETTMNPETRRLVQLTIEGGEQDAYKVMDMLLGKKRAADRKIWLEKRGDKAQIS